MTRPDALRRENEALRDRLARLSAAILRISASLDVTTVLHEVVDSARALTGVRPSAGRLKTSAPTCGSSRNTAPT